jgi:hypothetical protein
MRTTTCLDCTVLPPFSITLCPLHAAAHELRGALANLVDAVEAGYGKDDVTMRTARQLLVRLEGEV